MDSAQFYGQLQVEWEWEQGKKPYYSVWPSIVPMLTRLNLNLDSTLIQLPLPALAIRLPKEKNPLTFDWKGEPVQIRCMMLGEINEGQGLSIRIDIGEMMGDGEVGIPIVSRKKLALITTSFLFAHLISRTRVDYLPDARKAKLE